MACGAPVIAGDIPSIREVTGGAARLVPPEDVTALASAVVELLSDAAERQRLASAGLERAAEFSWERTARLTLEVYEEALRREGKGRK
jgi:glycosyltransferase involved in cell wall biosynthesis